MTTTNLLWSINERLGGLLGDRAEGFGEALPPLTTDFLADCEALQILRPRPPTRHR